MAVGLSFHCNMKVWLCRYQLGTGKAGAAVYPVTDYQTGLRLVYVHLPRDVVCQQCILQWTYTAGNNWGRCTNGGITMTRHGRVCNHVNWEG